MKTKRNCEVIHGDCVEFLENTQQSFEFVFADPPFNIGMDYAGYDDKRSPSEFAAWTQQWIETAWKHCHGVMALHGPDELIKPYLIAEERLRMRRIAWINWHYRFGQHKKTGWIDARCHCLIYAKHKPWTWNFNAIAIDSDRVAINDKRIRCKECDGEGCEVCNGSGRDKSVGKRPPGTVWGIPSDGPFWGRIQGNSAERIETSPNQLPEVYLERLIRAYTNPGDRVLDPFGGSGTTAVVADALGRKCLTIDISRRSVKRIKQRLKKGALRVSE